MLFARYRPFCLGLHLAKASQHRDRIRKLYENGLWFSVLISRHASRQLFTLYLAWQKSNQSCQSSSWQITHTTVKISSYIIAVCPMELNLNQSLVLPKYPFQLQSFWIVVKYQYIDTSSFVMNKTHISQCNLYVSRSWQIRWRILLLTHWGRVMHIYIYTYIYIFRCSI